MVTVDLPERLVLDARERFQVDDDRKAIVAALELAAKTEVEAGRGRGGRQRRSSAPTCRHCNLEIRDAPQWCPELDDDFCVP